MPSGIYQRSPEVIEKLRTLRAGKKNSENSKKAVSKKLTGRQYSHETKRKMSQGQKKRWLNASDEKRREWLKPMQAALEGKTSNTSIEQAIENALWELGVEYTKQECIFMEELGRAAIPDFYLPKYKTILECDGDYWHSKPETKEKDAERDKWFETKGLTVIRLPEWAIKKDSHGLAKSILHIIEIVGRAL